MQTLFFFSSMGEMLKETHKQHPKNIGLFSNIYLHNVLRLWFTSCKRLLKLLKYFKATDDLCLSRDSFEKHFQADWIFFTRKLQEDICIYNFKLCMGSKQ